MLKIIKHGDHILVNQEGLFSGAGIRSCFKTTEIIFYSETSKYDQIEAIKDIKEYVASHDGQFKSSGWSTKTQSWRCWSIPCKFEDLKDVI
jgi:hypothetical protein